MPTTTCGFDIVPDAGARLNSGPAQRRAAPRAKGGAGAGALLPARGRHRLAPPLTALRPLCRRAAGVAQSDGRVWAAPLPRHPPRPRPAASPRTERSAARRRRRASRAATLAPSPDAHPAQTALRDRRSSDRASGRCSAPPSRAPRARCAAAAAPPSPSVSRRMVCGARTRSAHGSSPPPYQPRRAAAAAPATAAAPVVAFGSATGDGKNASPAPGHCYFRAHSARQSRAQ